MLLEMVLGRSFLGSGQEQRHEVRKAVPETEELKVLKSRIAELVQEVEDKNAELEEKTQIVGQLKEQMAQIIPLVGGFAPEAAERLILEQPEPESLACTL